MIFLFFFYLPLTVDRHDHYERVAFDKLRQVNVRLGSSKSTIDSWKFIFFIMCSTSTQRALDTVYIVRIYTPLYGTMFIIE